MSNAANLKPAELPDGASMPVPQPTTFEDMDRMRAEADERWRNRPRPVKELNADSDLIREEPRVCRLPNGGVSENVRQQMMLNRQRREEEARLKAAQEKEQEDLARDLREL